MTSCPSNSQPPTLNQKSLQIRIKIIKASMQQASCTVNMVVVSLPKLLIKAKLYFNRMAELNLKLASMGS